MFVFLVGFFFFGGGGRGGRREGGFIRFEVFKFDNILLKAFLYSPSLSPKKLLRVSRPLNG